MKRRLLLSVWLLLLLFGVSLLSCDKQLPSQPVRDNPLDVENPGSGGDPYELSATIGGGGITLSWNQITEPRPDGYNIYRSLDEVTYALYQEVARVGEYTDTLIQNGHRYDYYVIARGARGEEGDASNVVGVSIDTDPMLLIESDTTDFTPTRDVELTLLAFGATEMRFASDLDFADGFWEPYSSSKSWQLDIGPGTKQVYAQVRYDNESLSTIVTDTIEPASLNASVAINNGADTTSFRSVTLIISAIGATEMWIENVVSEPPASSTGSGDGDKDGYLRLSPTDGSDQTDTILESRSDPLERKGVQQSQSNWRTNGNGTKSVAETSSEQPELLPEDPIGNEIDDADEWLPFSETIDWELTTGAGTKTVRVHLRNDFEIEEETIDDIEPVTMNPSVQIANGAEDTPTRFVSLELSAFGAIDMQIANDESPVGEDWDSFTETVNWQLTTGSGTKTVFVRLRNDFLIEAIASGTIQPAPLNPTVVIANGAQETATRNVTLDISANGAIEMQIANESPPGGDSWGLYTTEVNWQLATGTGTKTVYARVRSDFLIDELASDEIEPATLAPSLTILPDDSSFINHHDIQLSMPGVGATLMKASNSSDSSGISWQTYAETIDWELSANDGAKQVFAWFSNDFFSAGPASDQINIDTQVEIEAFDWFSIAGDTLDTGDEITFTLSMEDDAFGAESGGTAIVTVNGWDIIYLTDNNTGNYNLDYDIDDPPVQEATVTASFIDRAGNESTPVSSEHTLTRLVLEYLTRTIDDEAEYYINSGSENDTFAVHFSPEGPCYITRAEEMFFSDGNIEIFVWDYSTDAENMFPDGIAPLRGTSPVSPLGNVLFGPLGRPVVGNQEWETLFDGNDIPGGILIADGSDFMVGFVKVQPDILPLPLTDDIRERGTSYTWFGGPWMQSYDETWGGYNSSSPVIELMLRVRVSYLSNSRPRDEITTSILQNSRYKQVIMPIASHAGDGIKEVIGDTTGASHISRRENR